MDDGDIEFIADGFRAAYSGNEAASLLRTGAVVFGCVILAAVGVFTAAALIAEDSQDKLLSAIAAGTYLLSGALMVGLVLGIAAFLDIKAAMLKVTLLESSLGEGVEPDGHE